VAPRPDYASFVWAACPSAPDTTASSLAPRRDRAKPRPPTPAPRHDIAKPLASCRSETQRTAPSQERVSFRAFCCRKILIEKQGHKELAPLYIQVAIKIAASGKKADANKRASLENEDCALGCVLIKPFEKFTIENCAKLFCETFLKIAEKNTSMYIDIFLANLNFDKNNILF